MVSYVKLTKRSSNRKTGPIATTMTSSDSCPTTCPFRENGCYAKGGPTAINWRRLDRHETGTPLLDIDHQLAAAQLLPRTLLRWNVAGDLPHVDGQINLPVLQQISALLVQGYQLRPYTYTHHVQTLDNLNAVAWLNAAGFVVNLSCESESVAGWHHRNGRPAVCVVRSDDTRRSWQDEHGTRFQTCPAQLNDRVTCATCQLCTRGAIGLDRHCVIAFRAHGSGKRRVEAVLGQTATML